jgi:hypothetical protein
MENKYWKTKYKNSTVFGPKARDEKCCFGENIMSLYWERCYVMRYFFKEVVMG